MMKNPFKNKSDTGFTLIELLMAMALFGFMMLIISAGFINIVKIYRSTIAARKTQESARFVLEEIARYSRVANVAELNGNDVLCLYGTSNVRFRRLDDAGTTRLVRENFITCSDLALYSNRQILTALDLRVPDNGFILNLIDATQPTPSVEITLKVATNSPDLFDVSNNSCDSSKPGVEFCSTTLFTTTLALRGESSP